MSWVVRFEGVTKKYRTEVRHWHLRHDLVRMSRKMLRILRDDAEKSKERVALDNVSFVIEEGEAFAFIGPNGAGKSTALKLLTRISSPTIGRIRLRGRVGALIEVGSGIHPELTGRENIWLYGRIIGMSRSEIARRFDAIVEFAELADELDIPVKMYSSGMQLRLGFSIASHLDPDIFIVDEVLAVGDASFQTKCIERMMQFVRGGGTLLFVSHDLSAVEAICGRGLFLLDGKVQTISRTREVLRAYLNWVDVRQLEHVGHGIRPCSPGGLKIEKTSFHDESGAERSTFRTGETMEIRLKLNADVPITKPLLALGISDGRSGNLILCSTRGNDQVPEVLTGKCTVTCRILRLPLLPRVYQTWCSIRNGHAHGDLLDWQIVGAFRVADGPSDGKEPVSVVHTSTDAPIYADYQWWWRGMLA